MIISGDTCAVFSTLGAKDDKLLLLRRNTFWRTPGVEGGCREQEPDHVEGSAQLYPTFRRRGEARSPKGSSL